jgi:hypothetical protein
MSENGATVSVSVNGGPSANVPWQQNLTALGAMEAAYAMINPAEQFTFALQYYGPQFGYLVIMINETYDSFISKGGAQANPFFYWEFLVNGKPATQGVGQTVLNPGDAVEFDFQMYQAARHDNSPVGVKHAFQLG